MCACVCVCVSRYADTIQREVLQFEDHRTAELKRADGLALRLAKAQKRAAALREDLARQREATAEARLRAREERAAKEARLQHLKRAVHSALLRSSSSGGNKNEAAAQMVALLRRAVQLHGSSPAIVAACRREIERVAFVKEMMPAVKRHIDGVEYFQRLKQSGLELTQQPHQQHQQQQQSSSWSSSSADLDHLAISLCNAGIILEQNAKELLARLDTYRVRFGAEFCYRGQVVRDHLARVQELLQSSGGGGGGVMAATSAAVEPAGPWTRRRR